MSLFEETTANAAPQVGFSRNETKLTKRAASSVPLSLGVALIICGICAVGFGKYRDYSVISAIQLHGQRQEAPVLRLRKVITYGRKNIEYCNVFADYRINPQGWNGPMINSIRLGNCDVNIPAAEYATQNHSLPIAYDVTNPHVAHLNFDDEAFREDAGRTLKEQLLTLVSFAAFGIFALTAVSLFRKS